MHGMPRPKPGATQDPSRLKKKQEKVLIGLIQPPVESGNSRMFPADTCKPQCSMSAHRPQDLCTICK